MALSLGTNDRRHPELQLRVSWLLRDDEYQRLTHSNKPQLPLAASTAASRAVKSLPARGLGPPAVCPIITLRVQDQSEMPGQPPKYRLPAQQEPSVGCSPRSHRRCQTWADRAVAA